MSSFEFKLISILCYLNLSLISSSSTTSSSSYISLKKTISSKEQHFLESIPINIFDAKEHTTSYTEIEGQLTSTDHSYGSSIVSILIDYLKYGTNGINLMLCELICGFSLQEFQFLQ